jgi:hypothetical protein
MTPVDQLFSGDNAVTGIPGDCWRACIASVLDLPADEVPHFVSLYWSEEDPTLWYFETASWLKERGYALETWAPGPPPRYNGYAIASGPSPRGDFKHAVVRYVAAQSADGMLVWDAHDPHPSRAFVPEVTEYAVLRRMQ